MKCAAVFIQYTAAHLRLQIVFCCDNCGEEVEHLISLLPVEGIQIQLPGTCRQTFV